MGRKILFTVIVAMWGVSIPAVAPVGAAIFDLFPVEADGSTTEQTVYDFNETPFVYFRLPFSGQNFVSSFWENPDGVFSFTSNGPETTDEVWLSLNNWPAVRKVGTWDVGASALYTSGVVVTDSTSFNVTPEPTSALLFLTGGLAIAASARRRNTRAKRSP